MGRINAEKPGSATIIFNSDLGMVESLTVEVGFGMRSAYDRWPGRRCESVPKHSRVHASRAALIDGRPIAPPTWRTIERLANFVSRDFLESRRRAEKGHS